MTSSTSHISFEVLAGLTEQGAASGAPESLINHLGQCSDCSRSWQEVRQLVNLMRSDDSIAAPQPLIARALNIFSPPASRPVAEGSLLRRIVAALTFDSLNLAPAFGVRSGKATTRQMIFSAGNTDVDLRIAAQDEHWTLSGQILGTACAKGEVQLQSESVTESAILNEYCEFTFSPVETGTYSLRLLMAEVEVEFPAIELKA